MFIYMLLTFVQLNAIFLKPTIEIAITEIENRKRFKLIDRENNKIILPTFYDGEDVSGKVIITLNSQTFEHKGIIIELNGAVRPKSGLKKKNYFVRLSSDLLQPGIIKGGTLELPFTFTKVQKPYESFRGDLMDVIYYLRVVIDTKFRKIKHDQEFNVINPQDDSILKHNNERIRLEVGIDDVLTLCIKLYNKNNPVKGVINGEVMFKVMDVNLQTMELRIIKKEEIKGEKDASVVTLEKFEIMDGVPQKNEVIPIRLDLKCINLTPTYENVHNKFSVTYMISLLLIDDKKNNYYKDREVKFFRVFKNGLVKKDEFWNKTFYGTDKPKKKKTKENNAVNSNIENLIPSSSSNDNEINKGGDENNNKEENKDGYVNNNEQINDDIGDTI